MEEKLRNKLSTEMIEGMVNPIIVMHTKDLKAFIKQTEARVDNLKVGENPTYQGIPIKAREYVEKGQLIIYDDYIIPKIQP